MSPCPIPISTVPEALRKHVDPKSPPPLRMMASRGMVPMGPKDMVTVLTCLTFDDDEKIELAANKSLAELPERIVAGALGEKLHPLVLDHLARALPEDEKHLEAILTNRDTPDETFEYLGDRVSERLLSLITENQVRILRHPPIAKAILDNPNVIKSEVERLMDFAVRTGMDFRGMQAFEDAKQPAVGSAVYLLLLHHFQSARSVGRAEAIAVRRVDHVATHDQAIGSQRFGKTPS